MINGRVEFLKSVRNNNRGPKPAIIVRTRSVSMVRILCRYGEVYTFVIILIYRRREPFAGGNISSRKRDNNSRILFTCDASFNDNATRAVALAIII